MNNPSCNARHVSHGVKYNQMSNKIRKLYIEIAKLKFRFQFDIFTEQFQNQEFKIIELEINLRVKIKR